MKENILQIKGLKKHFPVLSSVLRRKIGTVKAIDDVSFEMKYGQILGVVGESGSGKSALARTLIQLEKPDEGQIIFCGKDLLSTPPKELKKLRRNMQMIFQDPFSSLNPRKSIAESIGEGLLIQKIAKTKSPKNDIIVETLKQVGLSADLMNRYPHEFSGGQQQRICIARAIAMKPKLLICDEIVSALDVSIQAQILNLLIKLKEQFHLSYLFISHDLSVVRHICDYIIVVRQGKIIESASPMELFSRPKTPYTKKLLQSIPINHPIERRL